MATSALASHTKEREAWNKVMTSTYGIKLKGATRFRRTTRKQERRKSSRARKYKAALGSMDADAKAALHDARLEALEANNHREEIPEDDDDEYQDDQEDDGDYSDGGDTATNGKRKRKRDAGSSRERASKRGRVAGASKQGARSGASKKKSKTHIPKPITLEQVLLDPSEAAHFAATVTEAPVGRPRRFFCPLTGLPALYRDPKTGIPYATKEAFEKIGEHPPKLW